MNARIPSVVMIVVALALTGCIGTGSSITSLAVGVNPPRAQQYVDEDMRSRDHSVPAIVLMHGCGGVLSRSYDWKDRFIDAGFHAMILDSHSSRFGGNTCSGTNGGPTTLHRSGDAYGALDHLAAQPHIDPDRIYAMGWSEGGITLGLVASPTMLRFYDREGHPNQFAGVVAVYPHCRSWIDNAPQITPTLAVVASEDDWASPGECIDHVETNQHRSPLRIHVIDGATHSFDVFRSKTGRPLFARKYLGYRLVPNRAATEELERVAMEFLSQPN